MSETAAPQVVWLYAGADPDRVDADALAEFLRQRIPSRVEVRPDFLQFHLPEDEAHEQEAAEKMARARVKGPEQRAGQQAPKEAELDYERRFLRSGADKPTGLLYDADHVLGLYAGLLSPDELGMDCCHILVTNQLVGSWNEQDGRYHARAAVYGLPSIVSTCGLVEGPAKPREVYMARQLGLRDTSRDPDMREKCLDLDDPRMQDVVEGYLLQALFYHVTGDPFCEREDCRLYNAHWQENMLEAQTGEEAGLCPEHRKEMEKWTCS